MNSIRNRLPRDIDRMHLDRSETNFLPRLVACLALVDGPETFRQRLCEAAGHLNADLGTDYSIDDIQDPQAAVEIVAMYLKRHGNRVVAFAPSDAARIWAGGAQGHMARETIAYWGKVEAFYRSTKTTTSLKELAGIAG